MKIVDRSAFVIKISHDGQDGRTFLSVAGDLSVSGLAALRHAVLTCLAESPLVVVVDLTRVTGADAGAGGLFVALQRHANHEPSVRLMLVGPRDQLFWLLQTRIVPLESYGSRAEALAALATESSCRQWTSAWMPQGSANVQMAHQAVAGVCRGWHLSALADTAGLVAGALVPPAEASAASVATSGEGHVTRNADMAQVILKVSAIACGPGSISERARALLDPLRRVLPFIGLWIALLDPCRNAFDPLIRDGYTGAIETRFATASVAADLDSLGLNRPGPLIRIPDLGGPHQLGADAQRAAPAGLGLSTGAGIAAALVTPDGRHLGILAMHVEPDHRPTPAACALLGTLIPLIAHAVDPMRLVMAVTHMVADATAGIVLTRSGTAIPLPGLPDHPVLHANSVVLSVAARSLVGGVNHTTWLCPYLRTGAVNRTVRGLCRITALACPGSRYGWGVVMVSPFPNLPGLTHRELQVLGLLTEGRSNRSIATTLEITERTVAAHVEHVLLKMSAPSRTAAVSRALREGLYIPSAFIDDCDTPAPRSWRQDDRETAADALPDWSG
jgi:DNA-binding CsgD family transcriptional regulator/ABC-type transporter Mla MlaB component